MDILSLFHFLIYFFLAFYIKDNYLLIILLGISWEIFEYIITNYPPTRDFMIKHWPIHKKYWQGKVKSNIRYTETGLIIPWFTENLPLRIEDMFFNILGYYCGLHVSKNI